MPEKKSAPKANTAKQAKVGFEKLSDRERAKIAKALRVAISERDLPTFQTALLKLGFDENSAEFGELMKLWNDHWTASRYD